MKYKNLQEYLDLVLSGKETVTEAMIVQAKKEYRKHYLTRYRKRYKEKYVQISFRIPVRQYKEIQLLAKEGNVKPTNIIKQWATEKQGNRECAYPDNYKLYLLQLIDLTEEAIREADRELLPEILIYLKQMQEELR